MNYLKDYDSNRTTYDFNIWANGGKIIDIVHILAAI